MILRWVKLPVIVAGGALLVGGLLFGRDVFSYVSSGARSVQSAVKDAVPLEFELRRARDLLDQIIPEMHANVRLIAQEEVEVATLKQEIARHVQAVADEKVRIAKLRDAMATQQVRYTFGGREFTHEQVKEDLSRRFDNYREAEVILAGKHRLLDAREKSLLAAMQMLEKTKGQKARLEDQVAGLESQYRLIKAASVGSKFQMDNSKLAQTEKVIAEIKKRLDVAERVLAHETQFVQQVPVDAVSDKDLLQQVDEYFGGQSPGTSVAEQPIELPQPEKSTALSRAAPVE